MNQISFDDAYVKYRPRIERYLRHHFGLRLHDSEEVTSEVFSLLYERWNDFKVHNESGVMKYLYRAAKNKTLEYFVQRRKRAVACSIDDIAYKEAADDEPDEFIYIDGIAEHNKYLDNMEYIKASLTPLERLTFEYIVEKKYEPDRVAEELNTTESTVRVRWCRIRKKIENLILE